MTVSGHLLEQILLFGRALHSSGLDVNPDQLITLLHALDHVQISNKPDFYITCRCILVHRVQDFNAFDQIFQQFWHYPAEKGIPLNLPSPPSPSKGENLPRKQSKVQSKDPPSRQVAEDKSNYELLTSQTYSAREVLRHKDFSKLNADEAIKVKQLIQELVHRISVHKSRRWNYHGRKRDDLRKTLRRSIQYGGNIFEWIRRDPKMKPRPVIALADVSGSMERYTQMVLHFLICLSASLKHIEAFLFSTRLTRITPYLRAEKMEKSLTEISRRVPDWSGGTQIGEAIRRFNHNWGRRVLKSGDLVLIISDGWDRGNPHLLAKEIARLQRSCHRLIWLNPLLGIPKYEPLTRGLQAALPFIDDHLPVHNLASLEELARHFGNIPLWRDLRPQARKLPQPPIGV